MARPAPLTAQEMRRLDRNAVDLGVPVSALMASAGAALAREVARVTHKDGRKRVLLLCGKGNNGGDGLAAAVLLRKRKGLDARVMLAEPGQVAPAAQGFAASLPRKAFVDAAEAMRRDWSDAVLVDCLLGSGLKGAPKPPYASVVRWLAVQQKRGAVAVACDVPTGLGSRLAVQPEATVTFHAPKEGMTRANSGRIVVADIGMPAAAAFIGAGDFEAGYAWPRQDSHKGENGVVFVVAGSIPFTGAPRYCAMGAYRCGSDLVYVLAPAQAAATIRAYGPEPMVHDACPGPFLAEGAAKAAERLLAKAPKTSCLLIGPGLGTSPATLREAQAILALAARRGIPTVVDADGLDALTPALLERHGKRMVLTPHAREFRDLAGRPATPANVQAYARRHGVTVLCKGRVAPGQPHAVLVAAADGRRARESRRGHPAMTVGGTGDVLAGAVAALLAKGAAPFEAACAAAYVVGVAGEAAAALRSAGATAVDLHEAIPLVLAGHAPVADGEANGRPSSAI